jgi:hypothetical protein
MLVLVRRTAAEDDVVEREQAGRAAVGQRRQPAEDRSNLQRRHGGRQAALDAGPSGSVDAAAHGRFHWRFFLFFVFKKHSQMVRVITVCMPALFTFRATGPRHKQTDRTAACAFCSCVCGVHTSLTEINSMQEPEEEVEEEENTYAYTNSSVSRSAERVIVVNKATPGRSVAGVCVCSS